MSAVTEQVHFWMHFTEQGKLTELGPPGLEENWDEQEVISEGEPLIPGQPFTRRKSTHNGEEFEWAWGEDPANGRGIEIMEPRVTAEDCCVPTHIDCITVCVAQSQSNRSYTAFPERPYGHKYTIVIDMAKQSRAMIDGEDAPAVAGLPAGEQTVVKVIGNPSDPNDPTSRGEMGYVMNSGVRTDYILWFGDWYALEAPAS